MAKETFYFSHDYNARSDKKTKALIKKHGVAGYGLYWVLVEMLHEDEDSCIELDEIQYDLLSDDCKLDIDVVKAIIADCVNLYKLFDFDGNLLSNNRVERNKYKRTEMSRVRSEAGREGAKKRWNDSKPMANDGNGMANANSKIANDSKGKEIKESKEKKESKGDEIKKEPPSPKIDIPVSDEPKPHPKESPPIPRDPPIGEISISDCVTWYKSDAYEGTRQTVCMAKYVDMETLLDWVDAFEREISGKGEKKKSVSDFASHFFNWMRYQDMKTNPKTLIHKQKTTNEQRTGFNGQRGNNGGNPGKVLNEDYKRELASRMAGGTGTG